MSDCLVVDNVVTVSKPEFVFFITSKNKITHFLKKKKKKLNI